MAEGNLQSRMAAVGKRLRADFEASTNTQHRGSRGTEREEIFGKFLSLYLPGTVEVVHNAEIITPSGKVSPQCDILIADKSAPRLQDLQSHRIVPIECVYGVIEIKSKLTGPELRDACDKIAATKQLPRVEYGPAPMFGLIFGYDSIQLTALSRRFAEWCRLNMPEAHPDSVWIFAKGMLSWGPRGGGGGLINHVSMTPDREIRVLEPTQEANFILGLVIVISSLVSYIQLPPLNLGAYLSPGVVYWVKERLTPDRPWESPMQPDRGR